MKKSFKVLMLYLVLIIIIYAQIAVFGKSLLSSLYYPNQDDYKLGHRGREIVNTFNIDLASNAFYEEPINRLTGKLYLKGEVPLWNPYQGCGVPLAAQYSTRVFFPYQILENIFPAQSWDYFMLGRLLISAFFTYLFLNLIGLSVCASFIGGVCYMLSGSSVWFINNEQFANVAMTVPIAIFYFEKMIQNKNNNRFFVLASLSVALILLAGQPEVAVYALLLTCAYYIFRSIIKATCVLGFFKNVLKLIPVVILGLCASAIIIIPFHEYFLHSYNCHPPGGNMGSTEGIVPPGLGIGIFLPYIFELITHYRFFPHNGVWDYLGGYIGVLPAFLILIGIFCGKGEYRKYFLFFFIFAFLIILKNFGFPLMVLAGRLPFLDQAWSGRWAGPVWTFSLACAAAIGLENIINSSKNNKTTIWVIALSLLAMMLVYYPLSFFWMKSGLFNELLNIADQASFGSVVLPTLLTGLFIAACVLLTGCLLLFKYKATGKKDCIFGIVLLLIFELWFYVPQGMDPSWRMLKIIPFLIGVIAVWSFTRYKRLGKILCVIAVFSNILIDVNSPQGMPERRDPFSKQPYVKFLEARRGYYRVTGTGGILIPNFASAFGIFDIRYIDSLSPEIYQNYVDKHLLKSPHNYITDRLWFTGIPDATRKYSLPADKDIQSNLPFYSFLGVKYILVPKETDLGLPLVYDQEIKIYENISCLPRIFIVHDVGYAASYTLAQEMIAEARVGAGSRVILEVKIPERYVNLYAADNLQAAISSYRPNRVVARAFLNAPGILVLTDIFYPGWKAYVDGKQIKIYRVNGLVRGVLLEEGEHTVVFTYFPESFKIGLYLFILSILVYLIILIRRTRQIK
jgi:hypothetical protein